MTETHAQPGLTGYYIASLRESSFAPPEFVESLLEALSEVERHLPSPELAVVKLLVQTGVGDWWPAPEDKGFARALTFLSAVEEAIRFHKQPLVRACVEGGHMTWHEIGYYLRTSTDDVFDEFGEDDDVPPSEVMAVPASSELLREIASRVDEV